MEVNTGKKERAAPRPLTSQKAWASFFSWKLTEVASWASPSLRGPAEPGHRPAAGIRGPATGGSMQTTHHADSELGWVLPFQKPLFSMLKKIARKKV